jgi:hypothetical protein
MKSWALCTLTTVLVPLAFVPSAHAATQRPEVIPTEIPLSNLEHKPRILAQKQPRIALVIGNGSYEKAGKLSNPPNDAKAIAQALESIGFEVTLRVDLNQKLMEQEINNFNRKLRQGGVGLFYYAGHGVQAGEENYLIPINANLNQEKDLRYDAVPLGKVLGGMEEAKNSVNIVILDACRDNPYAQQWGRSLKRGLAPIRSEPAGMLISFATASGTIAEDGAGENSPYTASLLQHIKKPGVPLALMFEHINAMVKQQTNNRQIPRYQSSGIGDFVLNPDSNNKPILATAPTTSTKELERAKRIAKALREITLLGNSRNPGYYSDWQVKGDRIPLWSRQCIGRSLTPEEFESNEAAATSTVTCIVQDMFHQEMSSAKNDEGEAIRRIAAWWVTGDSGRYDEEKIATYTERVLKIYKTLPQ